MTLAAYLQRTYTWLSISLLISALTSWIVMAEPGLSAIFFKPHGLTIIGWIVTFAPIAVIMLISFAAQSLSLFATQGLFILFSVVYGISLSMILAHYTAASVMGTFLVTAGAFFGLSVYGVLTKRDLSPIGTFMMVLMIGLVIAGLVNMFLHSAHLNIAITIVALVVYGGLTAWDNQKIKNDFNTYGGQLSEEAIAKMVILSAMSLYIDFIGMFQSILNLVGSNNE